MLRELRVPSARTQIFCLTLARRGRNVRPHRIADASDSEAACGVGTDVRANRGRVPNYGPESFGTRFPRRGRRTGKSVEGRLRGQARRLGAGGKAPRRSELQTQRRLLG